MDDPAKAREDMAKEIGDILRHAAPEAVRTLEYLSISSTNPRVREKARRSLKKYKRSIGIEEDQ